MPSEHLTKREAQLLLLMADSDPTNPIVSEARNVIFTHNDPPRAGMLGEFVAVGKMQQLLFMAGIGGNPRAGKKLALIFRCAFSRRA